MKDNKLILVDGIRHLTYNLDDRLIWEVGRGSDGNVDINLHAMTVSRKHGRFQNIDGVWFYIDYYGKNGTVYNGRHLEAGINGCIKPVLLEDGDILIFGGGNETAENAKTAWCRFSTGV
jgi:pSer/pThr/pTyr-binding forkhead associated (FHA) protein